MSRDFRHDTEAEPNMRTSSPVRELVERIQHRKLARVAANSRHAKADGALDDEAASTLITLSTRNAELEREVKRLREALAQAHDIRRRLMTALSTSPHGGEADNERIREGMERILKEQSERDIPFAHQGSRT